MFLTTLSQEESFDKMAQLVGSTLIMTAVMVLVLVLVKPSKKVIKYAFVAWVLIAFALAIIFPR